MRTPLRARRWNSGWATRRRIVLVAAVLLVAQAISLLFTTGLLGSRADAAPASEAPAETTAAEAHPLTRADVDAWLDDVVPAALEEEGIVGATVSVVDDGETLTARGFGEADHDAGVEVDPDETLFRMGSVSKLFTATAVMQLVERGELDLDEDVDTYLDFDLPTTFDTPITLRNLLTHTAGFEERVRGLIGEPDATVDLREALATDPPEQIYEPGTVPAYSNYGNSLAGYIVQRVSGEPFEQYVAEHVLEPAGMTSSSFEQPLPDELADRLSQGYDDADSDPVPFETVGTPPAGALTSSATDMARFMLAQLGDGARLLRPATLEQMHAPALDEDTLGGLADGPRMTLGFFDRSRNGHRIIEHGGDTNVFHSDLELYPDDGTGVFVSFNSSGTDPASTVELRDELLEEFADRYYPGEPDAEPGVDPATAQEHAEALAGTYESSRTVRSNWLAAAYAVGQTTITAQDDGTVRVSPGSTGGADDVYEEVRPWVWRLVDGDREIAARVVDGEVEAIGVDNAFALLPVPAERRTSVLLPVLGGSAVVLLLGALGWALTRPVRWVRLHRGTASPRGRDGRVLRVLTRVGVGSALLALVGWALLATQVMGLGTPPTAAIRLVQVLQLLGLLGVVPAALWAVAELRRRSWWRVVVVSVLAVGLVGVGWGAVTLHLLTPDISY